MGQIVKVLAAIGRFVAGLGGSFARWLGPAANALRGQINTTEAMRIFLLGISSGTLSGLVSLVLANTSLIFIDPTTAGLVSTVLTGLTWMIDCVRRLRQGHTRPADPPRGKEAVTRG